MKKLKKAQAGGYSNTGYLADSPDRFNAYNIIPSNLITMNNVPHDVLAIADNGQTKLMKKNSGLHKFFGANSVTEVPMKQNGGAALPLMDPNTIASKRGFKTTSGREMLEVMDGVHMALGQGPKYLASAAGQTLYSRAKGLYGEPATRDLTDKIAIFNQRPDIQTLSPQDRLNSFYSVYKDHPLIQQFNSVGYGPQASVNTTPSLDVQGRYASYQTGGGVPHDPDIKGPIGYLNSYNQSDAFKKRFLNRHHDDSEYNQALTQAGNASNNYHPYVLEKDPDRVGSRVGEKELNKIFSSPELGVNIPSNANIILSRPQAKALKTSLEDDITPHEYAHTTRVLSPIDEIDISDLNRGGLKSYQKYLADPTKTKDQDFTNWQAHNKMDYHATGPGENYSDLSSLRYMLYKHGIYDTRKGDMTPDHIKAALKNPAIRDSYNFKRLRQNFSDKNLIRFNNEVASNDPEEDVNQAAFGGAFYQNGGMWDPLAFNTPQPAGKYYQQDPNEFNPIAAQPKVVPVPIPTIDVKPQAFGMATITPATNKENQNRLLGFLKNNPADALNIGLGILGNSLAAGKDHSARDAKINGTSDNIYSTTDNRFRRGDWTTNEGYYRPDQLNYNQFEAQPVPTQYGIPRAQLGLQVDLANQPINTFAPSPAIQGPASQPSPEAPQPAQVPDVSPDLSGHFQDYASRADKYISKVNPKAAISGDMLAQGAAQAYQKFGKMVPVQLALAQLKQEGFLEKTQRANKPQRTNNPFNVGNTDDGSTKTYGSVQTGVNNYFNLIAKSYLSKKSPEELLESFTNGKGGRYASDKNYETSLKKIIGNINKTIYKEGGTYSLSDSEIQHILANGGEVEYL